MGWIWNRGGPDTNVPEYNFKISLNVKLDGNRGNVGIFEIIGMRNGGGHDRHIGINGNLPYYRTWPGGGYGGNFNGIDVWDGNFHTWELVV